MLRGAFAAAVTPLRRGGRSLDEPAVEPYVSFLADAGLDGVFALGTTGEGILLESAERRRAAELFVEAAGDGLPVVVHCGAQTTDETVALCDHAASLGVAGIAVVGPPYFAWDDRALAEHFLAAAKACEPVPFYLYEFAARSGYAIPLEVVARVREEAPNLAGLKVSDQPYDSVKPYLLPGLAVFVGAEGLVPSGMGDGAAGSVSGLASVFPEPVVAMVAAPSEETAAPVQALRKGLERFPFVPAAKRGLGRRGVPVKEDLRAPFLPLSGDQAAEVDRLVDEWLASR